MPSTDSWRSLYPFTSHELRLPGGERYHYLDEGAGEPLLLVHGNPTWSFYWRRLIAGLSDRYRLVAVDHIGCGLSGKPSDYPYTLAQHVENLTALVRKLDLRGVTLIGHDWGGAIGMGAAVAQPERFARLMLLNTAAFRSQRIPRRISLCRMPLLGTLAVRGANAFLRAALSMATCRPELFTPQVIAGYQAPYDSWNNRIAIDRFVKDIPLSANHPSYTTLGHIEEGLPQFQNHPISLIWGMRDWCFTPHFLERFLEIFPLAEAHRLEEAGHWVAEDAHEDVEQIVADFLARHPVSGVRDAP